MAVANECVVNPRKHVPCLSLPRPWRTERTFTQPIHSARTNTHTRARAHTHSVRSVPRWSRCHQLARCCRRTTIRNRRPETWAVVVWCGEGVRDCVDAWVCRYVNVWLSGCLVVWSYVCVTLYACLHTCICACRSKCMHLFVCACVKSQQPTFTIVRT